MSLTLEDYKSIISKHPLSIQIIHGKCLDELPRLEPNSIDMVFVDLPYGLTKTKGDKLVPFEPMWSSLKRLIKQLTVPIVMTASQPFTSLLVCSNIKNFRCEWTAVKNRGGNFGSLKYHPFKEHDNIIVFSFKTPMPYNPQMIKVADSSLKQDKLGTKRVMRNSGTAEVMKIPRVNHTYEQNGLRNPSSVLYFNIPRGKDKVKHPLQKPLDLVEYFIKTYSNEGDTILDFTAGSFTTGVAAVKLNRNFIGIEKEKEYYELGIERIGKQIIELQRTV